MCETLSPTVPPCGMGEIKFPENGNPGSGDLVCGIGKKQGRKRRKKPYTQKGAHAILSFEEFSRIQKNNEAGE